jgi:hypothetical protein
VSTTEKTHGIVLYDEHGREIDPEHTRLAFTGDVFLNWGVEDMPAQGAEFKVTIHAKIVGGVNFKEIGDDPKVWIALVKGKVEEASAFTVLETPVKQGPLDELHDTIVPPGTKATVTHHGKTTVLGDRRGESSSP